MKTQPVTVGAEYYDETLSLYPGKFLCHYSESPYLRLWEIATAGLAGSSVLDLGCGPGQVADLLRDRGVERYLGLDYAPGRVARAVEVCPSFEFAVFDLTDTAALSDLVARRCPEVVIAFEFLEHIEHDRDVLAALPVGIPCRFTVPSKLCSEHWRAFECEADVRSQYGDLLEISELVTVDEWYYFAGVRT